MKQILIGAAALALLASPVLAGSCPKHMKAIDAALATSPQLSAADMGAVTKARADGEMLHKTGKHKESVETLLKAENILKIKM